MARSTAESVRGHRTAGGETLPPGCPPLVWFRGAGSGRRGYVRALCAAGGDAGHARQATARGGPCPPPGGHKRSLPPVERHRDEVGELARPVGEAPQRPAGGAVLEV